MSSEAKAVTLQTKEWIRCMAVHSFVYAGHP